MGILNFILVLFISGCATKYIVPTNRFMTPESQGGFLNNEFEFQSTQATQLQTIAAGGEFNEGVNYSKISRSGFSYSLSLFESFDLVWSHVGSGNSLGGIKFQIFGDPGSSKAVGNKLAFVALMGGNDYETEDKSVLFRLDAQEFVLIYGYRISEFIMPYLSLSKSKYSFEGTISSLEPEINGKKPNYVTDILSLNVGGEFNWEAFFLKPEFSYQQIDTDGTNTFNPMTFGFSLGVNW